MFLTTDKLVDRFQDNLKYADQVNIAVAWATSGTALDLLETWEKDHPKRIRAIVGIYGNATEPEALERLAKIGELRLVEGSSALFHPKVYIFQGQSLIAWVGSANLTKGGFQYNEETIFETKQGQNILTWFEERWKECNELQPGDINNYHLRWEQKKPQPEFKALTEGSSTVIFARDELKPVKGRNNILEAFKLMRETLKDGADRFPGCMISTPGGSEEQDVYWHPQYEFWFSFRPPQSKKRFWNSFGHDDLQQKNTSPLTPTVEINPPLHVGVKGNNGGALLRDRHGNIYLGHTGSITIVGHDGGSKSNFWDKYEKLCGGEDIMTISTSGKSNGRKIVLLGRVDKPDLKRKVSDFVRTVAKIKSLSQ